MKSMNTYFMLVIACMLTTSLSATYYVAGNGTDDPNGKWCNGTNWEFQALDGENTITFEGVAAGGYGFKIKDSNDWGSGTEYTTWDMINSDGPLYGGYGSNMDFTLAEEADVTISVVDGKVRLHATKSLDYRSNRYYITGNNSAMGDWAANSVALINDQISFSNLAAGWYECKITNGSWDKTWGYAEVDAANSSPMYKTYGDGNNICFRLQVAADVTVKFVKGQVVLLIDREYMVTGNGHEIDGGVWLGGNKWSPYDADAKLDANYTHTWYTLPVASYQFKVKDYVNGWSESDDCTWGYAYLDTDNSNAGEDWSGNIGFNLSLPSDVKISIVDNKIRLNVNSVYFITGNGSTERGTWCNQKSWFQDDSNSRLDATTLSKTYTSLPIGEYEFKITNGRWTDGGGTVWAAGEIDPETSSHGYIGNGTNNIKFYLNEIDDVTITFNPETEKISLVSANGSFPCNIFSVVGQEELLGVAAWDAAETATELTPKGDGTYEYVLCDRNLTADNYEYKIIGGHAWGGDWEFPSSNATVSIAEDGIYDIVFTLNPAEGTQSNTVHKHHDVSISAYGYSTFYSDKAYIVPDGLTATIFTEVNGTALVGQSIDLIPANTGVLLSGTANATYALLQTTTDVTYGDNLFKGTSSDQTIADNGKVHYILGLHDGQCGLYWPNGTDEGKGAFNNKAGKAYLELGANAAPARVRGFALDGRNVATAVEDVVVEADNTFYDLLGRKVTAPQPGNVYICNGKKVVVF